MTAPDEPRGLRPVWRVIIGWILLLAALALVLALPSTRPHADVILLVLSALAGLLLVVKD